MPFKTTFTDQEISIFQQFKNEFNKEGFDLSSTIQTLGISEKEGNYYFDILNNTIPYKDVKKMIKNDYQRMSDVKLNPSLETRISFDHHSKPFKVSKKKLLELCYEIAKVDTASYMWIRFMSHSTNKGKGKRKVGRFGITFTGADKDKRDLTPVLKSDFKKTRKGGVNFQGFRFRNEEISLEKIPGFSPVDEKGGIIHTVKKTIDWLEKLKGRSVFVEVVSDLSCSYTSVILSEDPDLRKKLPRSAHADFGNYDANNGDQYWDNGTSCC